MPLPKQNTSLGTNKQPNRRANRRLNPFDKPLNSSHYREQIREFDVR